MANLTPEGSLSALQSQVSALVSAMESGLADLVVASESGGRAAGAMESALADLVVSLEAGGVAAAIEQATRAITALRPAVTVNVPPPVVHVVREEPREVTWLVTIPSGQRGAPDRTMTIKRLAA